MYYQSSYLSPIGPLTLASNGDKLVGLWLDGQKYFGGPLRDEVMAQADLALFDRTKTWLDAYFAGEQPAVSSLPLAPIGSEFRQAVWDLLLKIPYGQTSTYGALAKILAARLGTSSISAQAVGGAVGHNPMSIIIPCHRVVGANGSLTGYAGGVEKKQWLLQHEGAIPQTY